MSRRTQRNRGSRNAVVVVSCVAAAALVAAAFAACAKGVAGDETASDLGADARASASDVNHPAAPDTGYHGADAGHSNLDTGTDPGTPDAGDDDAFVPDDVSPPPVDAGGIETGTGDTGTGGTCGGLAEWVAGTTATKVKHGNERYTCIVPGWCSDAAPNSVAAYEPGKGWAWQQAWNDDGPCP